MAREKTGCNKRKLAGRLGAALFWLAFRALCVGQTTGPQSTEDALRAMTDAAGVVFTGTVSAVRKPEAGGIVEIDFAVADAIRGVSGSTYTLREWAGLWPANEEPFRPGQSFLMLLHTPNSAGLSSPVGGPDGAIPVRGAALISSDTPSVSARLTAVHGTAITETSTSTAIAQTIDLGWIATRVVVPVAYRNLATARPVPSAGVHAAAVLSSAAVSSEVLPSTAAPETAQTRSRSYSSVIALLRTWEANRAESR